MAAGPYRDLPTFLEHAREAQALRPAHGGVTYALASALALTGDTAGAFATLRHFAVLGYSADLAGDSDFVRLRGNEAYAELTRWLERNGQPVVATGWRSSFRSASSSPRASRTTRWTACSSWGAFTSRRSSASPAQGLSPSSPELPGRWAPLGLRVDRRRGALWVAAAALPQTAGHSPADSGRSAILRYDLRSGLVTARYDAPADGRPHLLGDLVITRDGDVYASDSRAPVLYRVPARGDTLEPFVESSLFSPGKGSP